MKNIDQDNEALKALVIRLREGITGILQNETKYFSDRQVMRAIPATVEQMFSRGRDKTAEQIIHRLGEGLINEDMETRKIISAALSKICAKLHADRRIDVLLVLSHNLIEWIRIETEHTVWVDQIFGHLTELAKTLIRNYEFLESDHILEVFNLIRSGFVPRDVHYKSLSEKALKDVATADIIDLLLKEYHTNRENKCRNALQCLVQLAEPVSEKLLDKLRGSEDMSERIQIVRALSEMGETVIPALKKRIKKGGPWYFMRNLILILGRVGSERHTPIIVPFLTHEDPRIRREALNAVLNIGGEYTEETILTLLPDADDRFRIQIVAALGTLKSREAVTALIDLVETGICGDPECGEELGEEICRAFSEIGSTEAIPTLIGMIKKQTRTTANGIPITEKVRAAAANALVRISGNRNGF